MHFARSPGRTPATFRLVIKFWLNPDGQIWRSQIIGSTGDFRRDRLFALALVGMKTDEPPPNLSAADHDGSVAARFRPGAGMYRRGRRPALDIRGRHP